MERELVKISELRKEENMQKLDLKKDLKYLYLPSAKKI
jgi:hypothetical protein